MCRLTQATLTLAFLIVGQGIGSTQSDTIRDLVRTHNAASGPLMIAIAGTQPQRTVRQLLPEADLVIDGTIAHAAVDLRSDERYIMTTYTVQPVRVLFSRGMSVDDSVTVVQVGGTMMVDGQKVIMTDTRLRTFTPGERVIWLLEKSPDTNAYAVLAGPYGSFEVRDGRVFSQLTDSVKHDFDNAPLTKLVSVIQQFATAPRP